MRLGLVILLCLLNTGCALWRADREEPVDNGSSRREKAEPRAQAERSAASPDTTDIASPVSDHFYMRLSYFQPSVSTDFRLDPGSNLNGGTQLNAEDDLGLDDQVNQGRIEFDMRMRERNHLRVDYFKLSRFNQQPLTQDIDFGDFTFDEGDQFRTNLDWRVFSFTYTYQFLKFERFEAGAGLGIHIIQAHASGGEPGTLNRESDSTGGIVPDDRVERGVSHLQALVGHGARAESFRRAPKTSKASCPTTTWTSSTAGASNFAVGLGYTKMETNLLVTDTTQPLVFNLDTSGPELFFRVSF